MFYEFIFQHSEESLEVFDQLKPWIADFLDHNTHMTASHVGYNQLVAEVPHVSLSRMNRQTFVLLSCAK